MTGESVVLNDYFNVSMYGIPSGEESSYEIDESNKKVIYDA